MSGSAIADVPLGEALQPAARRAVAQPLLEMVEAELLVETARRVPVEHVEVDAAPAAFERDAGEPRHQPPADAVATCRLAHENIFEEQRWVAEPGREPIVEQRHADRR